MKLISRLLNAVSTLILVILIFFVAFTIASNSSFFGKYKSYLIQSGSMEPTIMTGDIIVIKSERTYNINDTITFKANNRIITHRIIQVQDQTDSTLYTTKGDANRTEDEGSISLEQIIGKVIFVLPKVGFLVHFSRTPWGLIFLIIIPIIALIVDQISMIVTKGKA